jgi:hypothetical protein
MITITKNIPQVAGAFQKNSSAQTEVPAYKNLGLAISLVVMSFSTSLLSNQVMAESKGASESKLPIERPTDGKGKLPSFAEADINGDHYLTKDELKNFPYMLQTFDKVDAGEDGKLEDHEYQNLLVETKREGQVR